MPLGEHLRELRNRLFKAIAAILAVTVVAAFYYNELIAFLVEPVLKSVGCEASLSEIAREQADGKACAHLTMNGLLAPFTLALKVSLMAGVVLATPVWLYQLWAFLAPGLHANEKKYSLSFVAAGFPLFLGGGFFAYKILPTTAEVLIGFTPANVDNLLPLDDYLDLVVRMILVFGLSFELPLLLVMLNFGGVLTGRRMLGWWRGMVMGITLFAAIATPSTDPLSMMVLAGPIIVLYFAATGVSLFNDARRRRRAAQSPDAGLGDDEASDLDLIPETVDGAEPVTANARPEPSSSLDGGANGHVLPPSGDRDRSDDDIT